MAGRRRQSTGGSTDAPAAARVVPEPEPVPVAWRALVVPRVSGVRRSVAAWRVSWVSTRGTVRDAGMATAEYAIATIAAVGFAGLLVVVLRSGEVHELLLGIIRRALSV